MGLLSKSSKKKLDLNNGAQSHLVTFTRTAFSIVVICLFGQCILFEPQFVFFSFSVFSRCSFLFSSFEQNYLLTLGMKVNSIYIHSTYTVACTLRYNWFTKQCTVVQFVLLHTTCCSRARTHASATCSLFKLH